jgi:predicted dithiol-disulfide oxidoreductase (DUF899 family)
MASKTHKTVARSAKAKPTQARPAKAGAAKPKTSSAARKAVARSAETPGSGLPKIVSAPQWAAAREALLVKEKAHTRARDKLAAERRRLPMVRVEKDYVFTGPQGEVRLIDLFEGRPQLLLYHFMFAPGVHGWPSAGCPGCSMYLDNLGRYVMPHLHARDASFAVVSLAPLQNIAAYHKRMQWPVTWVSSANNTFNVDFGLSTPEGENHGLSVLFREGDAIFRTYFTQARGLETVGTVWNLLDLTPFGRQEEWEDTPQGRPKSAPYQWWHRHDEYT